MSNKINTFSDLKDSKILFDKDLPPFGYIIILVITFLLFVLAIWMSTTPQMYISKGTGTVFSTAKSYIMSSYTGAITEINVQEGSYVDQGMVLLIVASTDLDLQKEQIDGQIEAYREQITQFKKLDHCIRDNMNYFDSANINDDYYRNKFETYRIKMEQLQFDATTYQQYNYTVEQIEQEAKKNESKIEELYFTALQDINQSLVNINTEIEKLSIQEDTLLKGRSEYQVKASSSGTVHLSSDYKEGVIVQAGNQIGSISKELDQYIIESYVSVGDIPRIEINDKVDIEVAGLIQSDFGILTGVVKEIDSDVTINNKGNMFFKVRINLHKDFLTNKSGKKVNLSSGMNVETRIKYDQITYLEYLLDALGVKAR
jgi:multidrug efflux pump subunit AcrA (membrane-fusion protein)